MIDIVCGYTDPLCPIGDVYCADAEEALAMAAFTGGRAWVEFWKDGAAVIRNDLVNTEEAFL